MDPVELLKPGALFRARGRDYRLEHRQKDLLLARAVDTEEEALFYLPLEGQAIRLTSLGLPPAEPGDPALHDRSIPTRVGTTHDRDGKNARSPPFMCLIGSYCGSCLSRSPSDSVAVRLWWRCICLVSFSALRTASAFRTLTNTIPSKSRKTRSW